MILQHRYPKSGSVGHPSNPSPSFSSCAVTRRANLSQTNWETHSSCRRAAGGYLSHVRLEKFPRNLTPPQNLVSLFMACHYRQFTPSAFMRHCSSQMAKSIRSGSRTGNNTLHTPPPNKQKQSKRNIFLYGLSPVYCFKLRLVRECLSEHVQAQCATLVVQLR